MKKTTKKIIDPTLVAQKKLAMPVIEFLIKTPITANQISISNFLIFAPLSAYFFFQGGVINNLLGLISIFIYSFFDLVDGELARQKKIQSSLGHWLDMSLDSTIQTIIIFAIALNVLTNGGETWRLLSLLPLFGQSLANVLGMRLTLDFGIDSLSGSKVLDKLFKQKRSHVDRIIRNMIVPVDLYFISFFTLRFYMLVGIFFDILPFTFILFGISILIRSLSIYIILSLHYAKPELAKKYATFSYLNNFRK